LALLGFHVFAVVIRTVLVVAVAAIALIAICIAAIAEASSIAKQGRRRNPTRITRNPRNVDQSKIVFVEETAS